MYASLKPLASWIKNLNKRTQYFCLWAKNVILFAEGQTSQMLPYSIWISGFIFPQGLLASISQNFARKYSTSIDRLEFKYEIQNELFNEHLLIENDLESLFSEQNYKLTKKEGILLCGFYLDGAKYDREIGILCDSPQRFTQLPHILCKLILKKSETKDEKKNEEEELKNNVYNCPVYRNSDRAGNSNDQAKNFVTSITLNCSQEPKFWVLRGLCMILENSD